MPVHVVIRRDDFDALYTERNLCLLPRNIGFGLTRPVEHASVTPFRAGSRVILGVTDHSTKHGIIISHNLRFVKPLCKFEEAGV